ncbi:MAG: hypothetical protein KVP17_004152 [Porospora cf. gigantea B]|uniref:uncharacterized protein n=1 Tax=Porospora cf. gigantea B TaxID=2853592 RepID=UPI003571C1A7|nr:MAG: hypothetical protein KVP17_004152 [Porospora cf. gigantea B]
MSVHRRGITRAAPYAQRPTVSASGPVNNESVKLKSFKSTFEAHIHASCPFCPSWTDWLTKLTNPTGNVQDVLVGLYVAVCRSFGVLHAVDLPDCDLCWSHYHLKYSACDLHSDPIDYDWSDDAVLEEVLANVEGFHATLASTLTQLLRVK